MSDEVAARSYQQRWFVRVGANPHIGPVTTELLIRGIRAGRVPADAWIRKEGALGWNLWKEVSEVASSALAAAPLDTVPDVAPVSSEDVAGFTSPLPTLPIARMRPPLASNPPSAPSSRDLHELLSTPPPANVVPAARGSASSLLAAQAPSPFAASARPIESSPLAQLSSPLRSDDPAGRASKTDPPGRVSTSPWPSSSLSAPEPPPKVRTRGYSRLLPAFVITVFAIIGALLTAALLRHQLRF